MCCPRCVTKSSPSCYSAHVCGLLARYDPSKNSKCSLWEHTSFARPSMLEGTLVDVARFRARCAFSLDALIGGVPYRNPMNICPSWPNGRIAIEINAWLLSRIWPTAWSPVQISFSHLNHVDVRWVHRYSIIHSHLWCQLTRNIRVDKCNVETYTHFHM